LATLQQAFSFVAISFLYGFVFISYLEAYVCGNLMRERFLIFFLHDLKAKRDRLVSATAGVCICGVFVFVWVRIHFMSCSICVRGFMRYRFFLFSSHDFASG